MRTLPLALALGAVMFASAGAQTPNPPDRPAPRRRPLAIEGAYTIDGTTRVVRVKRLMGDVHHFWSSSGCEGVGILAGALYHGVFQYDGSRDPEMEGVMGSHVIDWTRLDSVRVEESYTRLRSGAVSQVWRRIRQEVEEAPEPAPPEPPFRDPPEDAPGVGDVHVEELPEAITKAVPVMPQIARDSGVSGTVQVQALVREDGTVGEVRIVKSIPMLDQAALEAVRQWRFKPALSQGKPTAVWVGIPIKFEVPRPR